MRVAFLLALLLASSVYTYGAFAELSFLTVSGRLGPGFFPRLIGVGLVATCLLSLRSDLRLMRTDDTTSPHWRSVGLIAALSGALVAMLSLLGGILAMAVFLMVALSVLNRGRPLQNLAVAVLLPAGIYVLFDLWLNASMPTGTVPLPI